MKYPNPDFISNHPLILCAQFNRPEICRLLLGSKPEQITKEDCYHAICSAFYGNEDGSSMIELLLPFVNDQSMFRPSDPDLIEYLNDMRNSKMRF